MAKFIVIKNWKQHQHYKDRNPPWVKLYRNILDDFDKETGEPKKFHKLSDSAKLTMILLIALAPEYDGRIPFPSEKWLRAKLGMQTLPKIEELTKSTLISIESTVCESENPVLATMLATLLAPETETEYRSTEVWGDACAPPATARRKRQAPATDEEYALWFDSELARHFDEPARFALGPAFPHIDIVSEIAKARAWAIARPPSERKRAIKKFVTSWLARSESRGATRPHVIAEHTTTVASVISDYDADSPELLEMLKKKESAA